MGKPFFIPDNILFGDTQFGGSVHYQFNAQNYQGVLWSTRQNLFYKMEQAEDIEAAMELFSGEEQREFERLFGAAYDVPHEDIIKRCLIVFIVRDGKENTAIGLEIIDQDPYVIFKSVKGSEVKALCKKHNITVHYDADIASSLLSFACMNEMVPKELFEKIIIAFFKIKKRNAAFSSKIKALFGV